NIINEFNKCGHKLLNVASGGDEPYCSKEVRAENGKKVARLIHDDPKRKRLWYLKQQLSKSLIDLKNRGDIDTYNYNLKKYKEASKKYPIFDSFNKFDYI